MLQRRCHILNGVRATAIGFVALSLAIGTFAPCRAQWLAESNDDDPLVSVQLLSDTDSIEPGRPFWTALRFDIADDWHINWKNPGDAGLAPAVDWVLPDGFSAEPTQWPFPQRYVYGPIVIFGYDSGVELLTRLTPPNTLAEGDSVTISANITWLACADACIPGESKINMRMAVGRNVASACADCPALEHKKIPAETGIWNVDVWYRDDYEMFFDMAAAGEDAPPLADVYFFPYDSGIIENAEAQELSEYAGGYRLTVVRSRIAPVTPERIRGVLVAGSGWGSDSVRALEVDVPLRSR